MRQVSLIGLVGVLTLFIGGCIAGQEEQQSVTSSPSPQAAIPIRPRKPSTAASPFERKPLVAQQSGTNIPVAGLIQPELPDNAVKRVPLGQRSDPFSAVPAQPVVTVSPNQAAGGTGNRPVPVVPPPPNLKLPRLPQGSGNQNQGATPAKPVPNIPRIPTAPLGTWKKPSSSSAQAKSRASQPNSKLSQPSATAKLRPPSPSALAPSTVPRPIPELPKLPEPTQARGVEVTGVAEVGGVPMAIVKVPNEPARYVREGQRIANGQVLVKRIEMNRGPEPVVILEQYGIEVARGVGEPPATSPTGPGQPPPPPTAFLPSASPLLGTSAAPQA